MEILSFSVSHMLSETGDSRNQILPYSTARRSSDAEGRARFRSQAFFFVSFLFLPKKK
jgi:hypothetical protein